MHHSVFNFKCIFISSVCVSNSKMASLELNVRIYLSNYSSESSADWPMQSGKLIKCGYIFIESPAIISFSVYFQIDFGKPHLLTWHHLQFSLRIDKLSDFDFYFLNKVLCHHVEGYFVSIHPHFYYLTLLLLFIALLWRVKILDPEKLESKWNL